jgi:hypothetical protein
LVLAVVGIAGCPGDHEEGEEDDTATTSGGGMSSVSMSAGSRAIASNLKES